MAVADDQPAARGGLQRDLPRRHADAVTGDGDALAVGDLADMRRDVFVAIANDMVGAGVARRLLLGLGADGADHGRAARLQPLDQNQSAYARRGLADHRPAGLALRAAPAPPPPRA